MYKIINIINVRYQMIVMNIIIVHFVCSFIMNTIINARNAQK